MNRVSISICALLLSSHLSGQGSAYNRLFEIFEFIKKDAVTLPYFSNSRFDFSIFVEDTIPTFKKRSFTLANPYGRAEYPIDYSGIYSSHLISLFEPGSFQCLSIPGLERNGALEATLNSNHFERFWIVDDHLYGLTTSRELMSFNSTSWCHLFYLPGSVEPPGPIAYQDDQYICFSRCNGEFGGTAYWYNRNSGEIHYTLSTCLTSITKRGDAYVMLSSLRHLAGHLIEKTIGDPNDLPKLSNFSFDLWQDKLLFNNIGYSDTTNAVEENFDYLGITALGHFLRNDTTYYIIGWARSTFIATIQNDTFKIIDPLFSDSMNGHEPYLRTYSEDLSLLTYNFFILSGQQEIAATLISDRSITRIDWSTRNKKMNRPPWVRKYIEKKPN